MKFLILFSFLLSLATAQVVHQDDFTAATIDSSIWTINIGSAATLDDPNNQLDYAHTAGTARRFLNYNAGLVSKTAYLKTTISNFTGASSIWLGFVGTTHGNNGNYARTLVSGNDTYELFLNNTTAPLPFDNGNGWSGSLPGGSGIYSTTGTSTTGNLTIGAGIAADTNIFGFGFANFGNSGVFPTSSFSVNSIVSGNSLTETSPGNTAPTVSITAPSDNSSYTSGTNVTFTATASDTEDGDIATSIVWTSDLDGNLGTGASINVTTLSNGTHAITASATDSNTLSANDSLTVSVGIPGNTSPTVTISAPANNTSATATTPVTFTASSADTEDGDLSSSIIWTSNLSGILDAGSTISVDNLAVGTHTITATSSDSEGLLGSATLTISITASSGTPGALRPNIIVIICDDAGYADFSFMDGISGSTSQVPTPHLDALAARGVTFSRAYVAANCQPTRAAIVTGAYQARIGNENVGNNNFRDDQLFEGIPVETDTVWDRMRNLGYTTGAIGKWHLGSIENTPERLGNRPENQGIDQFFGMWHGSREFMAGHYNESTDPDNPLQLRYIREALIHPDDSKTDVVKEYSEYFDKRNDPNPPAQYITNIFGDYAEDFVAEHHDDAEPFFLYVAHPAPHKPWTNNSPDYNDPRISGLTPNNRRQVASMMITMDKEIGDLMEQLDDPNGDGNTTDSIRDNTLVIFINDNGGVAGMENGVNGTSNGILNGFKGSAHDGGICVPMIMAGAGIDASKAGTVYHNPVHGIDLTPTSVALAGGTLDPTEDHIDGVNLIPFINGTDPATPHKLLVHRWRGTFAVIKDDMKLVNTQNVNTDPSRYKLYNVATDRGETNDLIGNAANDALVEELKRALTDQEAMWDKPRYPILNRTLESEPLNIVNHFTFRPVLHSDWSAGADEQNGPTGANPANWFEGGTTNPEHLFRSDGFSGGILEFPAHSADYLSNNDLRRKTGMEFMLNKIILSGVHSGAARTANLTGLPLIFTKNLQGQVPTIELTATGDFAYDVDLDLILYHDLAITGDGTATLKIDGDVSQYFEKRGIKKTGTSNAEINGARSYSGDTDILGGTLKIAQINAADDNATFRLANGSTLNLTYSGTDTIDRLFIDGVQQPAGVYGAELAQITGVGTLTVISGPGGFISWADQNAPGAPFIGDHDGDTVQNGIEYFMGETGSTFTPLPALGIDGTITWPISSTYTGSYGTDFYLETSPDLNDWNPVPGANVTVTPGTSLSHTLPLDQNTLYVRLSIEVE